jgi:[acyl-carrier-protein] S-malonyltransferase
MEPAEEGLREHLASVSFSDPRLEVFSNVTTRPVADGEEARGLLVRQLTAPVRWSESIRNMTEAGAEAFVELGSGSVLCGLNKRNAKGVPCRSIGTPADVEAFFNEGAGS